MRNDYTHVSFVLDNSGSMVSIKEQTIAAYNKFIEEQKKDPGKMTFSLYEFNNEISYSKFLMTSNFNVPGVLTTIQELTEFKSNRLHTLYEFKDFSEIAELNDKTYVPFTNTPLCEVLVGAINRTGQMLRDLKEEDRPAKVVFVILTDGYENASVGVNKASVKTLVEHQTEKYGWVFTFLGANMDAVAEGALYGVAATASMSYNTAKMGETISTMSATLSNYKSAAAGAKYEYTDEDRKEVI